MTPALGIRRQMDLEYEASLGHKASEVLSQRADKPKRKPTNPKGMGQAQCGKLA